MEKLISFIKIPKISDDCFLLFAQTPDHVPFSIKRVFFILEADTKLSRGFHAHKKQQQILFCLQGSIKIVLDNGEKREAVVLNKPEKGILLNRMIWHEMHNFKKNTVLLVLASQTFDPKDYIRDYQLFLKLKFF